jgi:hypothetical protein
MHKDSFNSTSNHRRFNNSRSERVGETQSSHHNNKFLFKLQLITDYCMQLNLILPMSFNEIANCAHILPALFVLSFKRA